MEENKNNPQETTSESTPESPVNASRPRWQVWAARIGLVLFLLFLAIYYIILFRGG